MMRAGTLHGRWYGQIFTTNRPAGLLQADVSYGLSGWGGYDDRVTTAPVLAAIHRAQRAGENDIGLHLAAIRVRIHVAYE